MKKWWLSIDWNEDVLYCENSRLDSVDVKAIAAAHKVLLAKKERELARVNELIDKKWAPFLKACPLAGKIKYLAQLNFKDHEIAAHLGTSTVHVRFIRVNNSEFYDLVSPEPCSEPKRVVPVIVAPRK